MTKLELDMHVTFDEVLKNCLADESTAKLINEIKAQQVEKILSWVVPMMQMGVNTNPQTFATLLNNELRELRS